MSEKHLSKRQKKLGSRNRIVDLSTAAINRLELKEISPLTDNQRNAFNAFNDYDDGYHLLLHGTAGTGKSFLSLYFALRSVIEKHHRKVIIFRSAVPTRDQGFLPGNEKEKAKVYELPYVGICSELFGRGDAYEILKQKGVIEFTTTSYVRGITLDNCIVVVDEIQNMSNHELDSIITRLGNNCRLIYCGDSTQSDFVKESDKRGLKQFIRVIERMKSFTIIRFNRHDIVRGPTVKEYIIAKEDLDALH